MTANDVRSAASVVFSILAFGAVMGSGSRAGAAGTEATDAGDKPEAERDDPKVAIQRPKFQMAHEMAFSFGVMPLDPFQKGLIGGFSYTLHFDRYFAWEVLRGTVAHLTSTNLRDRLLDEFAISEEDFNAPRLMLTSGFELSPIYGKQVLLNDLVVHQGLFLGVYAGAIFGDRLSFSETLSDLRPAVGGGIGYRLYVTKTISFRADIRDFISFRRAIRDGDPAELENVLVISGSIAFNLWRDDA